MVQRGLVLSLRGLHGWLGTWPGKHKRSNSSLSRLDRREDLRSKGLAAVEALRRVNPPKRPRLKHHIMDPCLVQNLVSVQNGQASAFEHSLPGLQKCTDVYGTHGEMELGS